MIKYGFIRQGDKTSCGRTVLTGLPHFTVLGKPIAVVGTEISCGCKIVEGWPSDMSDGSLIAFHGCLTSRKCHCISTVNGVAGFSEDSSKQQPDAYTRTGGEWMGIAHPGQEVKSFDEYFLLHDADGGPPAINRRYRLTLPSGEVIEGTSDSVGRTSLALSDSVSPVKVEIDPPSLFQAE